MKIKKSIRFVLFFACLVAPVLTFPFMKRYVDTKNYENRTLAERPRLFSSFSELESFSERYDRYFNDHLPYKNQLVSLHSLQNECLGAGTTVVEYQQQDTSVIRGKEKWLFYGTSFAEEQSVNDYLGGNLYEDSRLAEIAEGYVLLHDKLKALGKELVVFYAANKEQVYPEYMPDSLRRASYSRTDQLADYIRQNTDVPLIYAKEALQKEKQNHRLFYKYDTHWNDLGGFVGRQLIHQYFHGEYISLDDVEYSVADRNVSGDLADLLAMRSRYKDDVSYRIDDKRLESKHKFLEDGEDYYRFSSDAKDQRSVLMLMDSFGTAMIGILHDFGKVTFIKNEEDFLRFFESEDPDIVLLEIVERRKEMQENLCGRLYQSLCKEGE